MERLTAKCLKGSGYYMACSKTCPYDCMEDCDCEEFDNFVDRLGDIEDILGDEYDLERLRELAQADREGRCAIIPESIKGVDITVYSKDWVGTKFRFRWDEAALRREQE